MGGGVRMRPGLAMSGFRLSGTGVLRFNADGPGGLIDRQAWGQPSKLNGIQRKKLAKIVDDGPIPAVHGVVRWRLNDLALWIFEEFRISLNESTISRELEALEFSKSTARPHHQGQNDLAMKAFKKRTSPPT